MIFHAGKEDTNLSHRFLILVNVNNKLDLPSSGHAVREQRVTAECDPMCYQGTDESHNTPWEVVYWHMDLIGMNFNGWRWIVATRENLPVEVFLFTFTTEEKYS